TNQFNRHVKADAKSRHYENTTVTNSWLDKMARGSVPCASRGRHGLVRFLIATMQDFTLVQDLRFKPTPPRRPRSSRTGFRSA
ncbi:MAG TPA: hypothetical protein VHR64_13925, partial [Thermomicrobiales bacterium]|nr:hypothetical protein [Thermomicrobiales bacterium]